MAQLVRAGLINETTVNALMALSVSETLQNSGVSPGVAAQLMNTTTVNELMQDFNETQLDELMILVRNNPNIVNTLGTGDVTAIRNILTPGSNYTGNQQSGYGGYKDPYQPQNPDEILIGYVVPDGVGYPTSNKARPYSGPYGPPSYGSPSGHGSHYGYVSSGYGRYRNYRPAQPYSVHAQYKTKLQELLRLNSTDVNFPLQNLNFHNSLPTTYLGYN